MDWRKILLILLVSVLSAQEKIYVLIDSTKFPNNTIKINLTEKEKIPVDVKKEDLLIQEKSNNEYKIATIQSVQILNSFNIKKTETNNQYIYMMAFDRTRSISEKDFKKLKSLAQKFVSEKNKNDVIALYEFDAKPKLLQDFTRNSDLLKDKIKKINRGGKETKLYDAIFKVLLEYKKNIGKRKENIGGVIFFTDGKEETSLLKEEDIHELIVFGTKFNIPIYFVLLQKNQYTTALKKISLKTGGETFYSQIDISKIKPSESELSNEIYAKEMLIEYKSNLSFPEYLTANDVILNIYYKDNLISKENYKIENNKLYTLIYILSGLLILILITFFIISFIKKKNKYIQQSKVIQTDKMNFPEPQIGDVYIDQRNYVDEPQKKYIESEKDEIPLLAKNWWSTNDYMLYSIKALKKNFAKDTINLSLKEKSYMVLQSALKEAPKYNHGVLIKKDREGLGYDKKFDIFLDEVYIGSSTTAHIPVRDTAVSSLHAKIKRIDNKFIIFDLMSAGGTYLNGKKVLRPMPLRHNDEIRMGHTIFRFVGEN